MILSGHSSPEVSADKLADKLTKAHHIERTQQYQAICCHCVLKRELEAYLSVKHVKLPSFKGGLFALFAAQAGRQADRLTLGPRVLATSAFRSTGECATNF